MPDRPNPAAAALVLHVGIAAALAVTVVLLGTAGLLVYRSQPGNWTAPA